jgi:hypothetical protein
MSKFCGQTSDATKQRQDAAGQSPVKRLAKGEKRGSIPIPYATLGSFSLGIDSNRTPSTIQSFLASLTDPTNPVEIGDENALEWAGARGDVVFAVSW